MTSGDCEEQRRPEPALTFPNVRECVRATPCPHVPASHRLGSIAAGPAQMGVSEEVSTRASS